MQIFSYPKHTYIHNCGNDSSSSSSLINYDVKRNKYRETIWGVQCWPCLYNLRRVTTFYIFLSLITSCAIANTVTINRIASRIFHLSWILLHFFMISRDYLCVGLQHDSKLIKIMQLLPILFPMSFMFHLLFISCNILV
jgi:hypothetical protein